MDDGYGALWLARLRRRAWMMDTVHCGLRACAASE
jgi:hypothetical protein